MPFGLKAKEFSLQLEFFSKEHRLFIEKYEWLGTIVAVKPKGKYLYISGRNKKERRDLIKNSKVVFYDYPKRQV